VKNLEKSELKLLDGFVVLYKRERSQVWQVRLKLEDKQWHRFSTSEKNQVEAKKAAIKLYYDKELRRENKLPQTTKRFGAVADAVVKQMETERESGGGKVVFGSYISAINKYLKPFFKNRGLDSFTPSSLKEFDDWRKNEMGHAPKASTLNNHNSALNKVFDYAEQHGWITAAVRPSLKNKGKKSAARPAFTLAEYRTLVRKLPHWMKKAKTPKSLQMRELLRDYVLILANTGIRHGTEAMNLKWRDIENWKNEKQHSYLRVSVSGKTGRRSLIARDGTAEYFDRIKSRFDELNKYNFQKLLERKLDVAVFRLADGTVTNNLNQTFESFMKDSGLMYGVGSDSKRTLYSLRHTYATLQLMEGRGIHELAKQMGTSVQMIEQHYSKITPELMAYEFADRRRTDARKETEDAKVETAPNLKVVK